ncbi:mannonate dehydratase, partial [Xenorhabdus bovienii]
SIDSPANGITLCTGSLGVSADFDPVDFVDQLGSKVHFCHLRNTTRLQPSDACKTSFFEDEHLGGDVDMAATISALVDEERRRKSQGRS